MRKMTNGPTKLIVVDDLTPEDSAMLQALYSRSAESVETHLEKLKTTPSGKFMASYYVGYGHKSIADCGSTTMFIENVSLLAAKAIQDWPLYSGQETSTRYIDMSKQRIVDPVGTEASKKILDRWMEFYTSSQEPVADHIRKKYPRKEDEKPEIYERAVKARVFDILRGFLPAGITTQLSWHTNLRQAGDHLIGLTKHPVKEIKELGLALRGLLGEQYPSSGAGLNLASVSGVSNRDAEAAQDREKWEQAVASATTYTSGGYIGTPSMDSGLAGYSAWSELLMTRPKGCVLPHSFSRYGQVTFNFGLDFGSFRDLQRHRNGVVDMPLLTANYGFETWYLQELGPLKEKGQVLVDDQMRAIHDLTRDPFDQQYYVGLGFIVPCRVTWTLPSAVYVMELRSTKYVHPTLRSRILDMVTVFRSKHPSVTLHIDNDPDDWTVRRGQQTIEAR